MMHPRGFSLVIAFLISLGTVGDSFAVAGVASPGAGGMAGTGGQQLPAPSAVTRDWLERLVNTAVALPKNLSPAHEAALRDILQSVRRRDTQDALRRWTALLSSPGPKRSGVEIDDLARFMVREAYLPAHNSLEQAVNQLNQSRAVRDSVRKEPTSPKQTSASPATGGASPLPSRAEAANYHVRLAAAEQQAAQAERELERRHEHMEVILQFVKAVFQAAEDAKKAVNSAR